MISFDSLTSVANGNILSNVSLHTVPPISGLEILRYMVSLPRFSDIWPGRLTPSRCSYQGSRAPCRGKEYRGNTHGMRVFGCFSRLFARYAS
jgi:hypothetical protein